MYINIMKKLLPILLLTILVSLIACSTSNNDENGGLCPGAIASNKQYKNPEKCNLQPDKRYIATIQMDKGDKISIELFHNDAPITVNSFIFLATKEYYDSLTFHRVIANFMAQTGDPTGRGDGGGGKYPGYTFDNELTPNKRHDSAGILSMANRGLNKDGSGTNGSQFFITFRATPWLDGYNEDGTAKNCLVESCHTVFGKVIDGLDAVLNIPVRDPGKATTPGALISKITIEEKE